MLAPVAPDLIRAVVLDLAVLRDTSVPTRPAREKLLERAFVLLRSLSTELPGDPPTSAAEPSPEPAAPRITIGRRMEEGRAARKRDEEMAAELRAAQGARLRAVAEELGAQLPPTLRTSIREHRDGDLSLHVVSSLDGAGTWGARVGLASDGEEALLRTVERDSFAAALEEVLRAAPGEAAEAARTRQLTLEYHADEERTQRLVAAVALACMILLLLLAAAASGLLAAGHASSPWTTGSVAALALSLAEAARRTRARRLRRARSHADALAEWRRRPLRD